MRSMGLDSALPPQGFYNAGQKLAAVAAVLCSVGLALSGLFLAALALHLVAPGSEDAAQWALFIHLLCAGVMAVVLPIHIYMAAFAPGEGPALRSMFSGFIPVTFIRHHNPLLGTNSSCAKGLSVQKPPIPFPKEPAMNIKTIASAVLAAVVLCAAPAFADGKMNLNTATEQELSANPAVGPELAKGIVEFRENVGDIKSMDELLEVKGVTPEVLEKLKQAVTVEAIEGAECSC